MRDVELYRHLLGLEDTVDRPVGGIEHPGAAGRRVGGPRRGRPLAVSRMRVHGWGSMTTPRNVCGGIWTAASS